MTPEPDHRDDGIRARQRSRAVLTGILLGAFVILMFAITIVKLAGKQ